MGAISAELVTSDEKRDARGRKLAGSIQRKENALRRAAKELGYVLQPIQAMAVS